MPGGAPGQAGLLRETTRVQRPSVIRTWSEPQAQRVHRVLPAAVACRDTTWKGSAPSGQPQCGQAVPVVPDMAVNSSDVVAG